MELFGDLASGSEDEGDDFFTAQDPAVSSSRGAPASAAPPQPRVTPASGLRVNKDFAAKLRADGDRARRQRAAARFAGLDVPKGCLKQLVAGLRTAARLEGARLARLAKQHGKAGSGGNKHKGEALDAAAAAACLPLLKEPGFLVHAAEAVLAFHGFEAPASWGDVVPEVGDGESLSSSSGAGDDSSRYGAVPPAVLASVTRGPPVHAPVRQLLGVMRKLADERPAGAKAAAGASKTRETGQASRKSETGDGTDEDEDEEPVYFGGGAGSDEEEGGEDEEEAAVEAPPAKRARLALVEVEPASPLPDSSISSIQQQARRAAVDEGKEEDGAAAVVAAAAMVTDAEDKKKQQALQRERQQRRAARKQKERLRPRGRGAGAGRGLHPTDGEPVYSDKHPSWQAAYAARRRAGKAMTRALRGASVAANSNTSGGGSGGGGAAKVVSGVHLKF